jgi:hypothetical protein
VLAYLVGLVLAATPLVLELVALIRADRQDIPKIMRALCPMGQEVAGRAHRQPCYQPLRVVPQPDGCPGLPSGLHEHSSPVSCAFAPLGMILGDGTARRD